MSEDEQSYCTKCGFSPATNHICCGGTGKSAQYCDSCFPTEDPLTAKLIAEARNSTCEYCGGSPCSGGPNSLSQMLGTSKNQWMCMPCSMEYQPFLLKKLENVTDNLSQSEQLDLLKKLYEEVDAHMRFFVRQRDN